VLGEWAAGRVNSSHELFKQSEFDRMTATDLYDDEAMRLLVVLASFTTVVSLATPAQAEPSGLDATFLTELNNAGITYQSGPDAIKIGRRACQLMDQGHPQPDVVKSMTEQNPGFTTDAATKFAEIAEGVYCPQHLGASPAPQQPPPPQAGVPPYFPWPALPAAP
jgi:Protein of unknown function (DUF732)